MRRGRSFWLIVAILSCMVVFALIFAAYRFNWSGAGFSKKTFWDWMQLLIIPFVLSVLAVWFNHAERKNEQIVASDNQQEAMLQGYLDKMSDLLLREKIREPVFENALYFQAKNEAQHVARARTLTVLSKLDASRKRSVLQFLDESGLIAKNESLVHLKDADFSGADLSGTFLGYNDLSEANLSKANLNKAVLAEVNLSKANLSKANLREARLSWGKIVIEPTGANLERADLSGADLRGAFMHDVILTDADLSR